MNIIAVAGIVVPVPKKKVAKLTIQSAATTTVDQPTVMISISPSTIPAGLTSAISWNTTGDPTTCTASGNWNGDKTQFGSESTGRISSSGNYTYNLSCSNKAGEAHATATLTVGNAIAPAHSTGTASSGGGGGNTTTVTYCGGRSPCYGPKQIASHGSSGNCWGWNIDRVIDISGFDSSFHQAKSGVSTIETSQICGHDLSGALGGGVPADGYPNGYNHPQSAKDNSNTALAPYFVGYFDNNKP